MRTMLSLLLVVLFVPGAAIADRSHAKVLWDGNYDMYITCRQGQTVATTWRLNLANPQDFYDAQAAGMEGFWSADQHNDLFFTPVPFRAVITPNGGMLVEYRFYANDNKMVFKWTGVKYGNPDTDTLGMYRAECRDHAPGEAFVAIPVEDDA